MIELNSCAGCQHFYAGKCSVVYGYGTNQAPVTFDPTTCPSYQDIVYISKKDKEKNKDTKRYDPHIETRFNRYCETCPEMDGELVVTELYCNNTIGLRSYIATCSHFDRCERMHKWIKENEK